MGVLNLLNNRIKIIKGLSKYQKTSEPKPIFAHLLLTNRCNLDCRYCFVDVNTIHKSDLQLEEWKQVISDLYERGCVSITLMGGEPLLFPGLYDLTTHAKELGVLPMSKEDLIKTSDFISIHVVLGKRYKNLITKKDLQMMKKSAFLINTSRGSIVNENDLIEALKSNQIAGAGIDVYNIEPLPSNHKLRFLPNALLLPHLGYVTAENYSIFYTQMLEDLEACAKGKPIRVIES